MFRQNYIFLILFILISTSCSQYLNLGLFDSSSDTTPVVPPAPPTVAAITAADDEVVSTSLVATPTISWTHPGLTAGAEGFHFEVAIGSTPGATDIVTWTDNGTSTTWSTTGLSLTLSSNYYATVRITDSAGAVYSTFQADGWKVVSPVTVAARYSIAPNWNSYANTITPTTVCAGSESGYFACIHGGEKKRIAYTPATSCTGYTIADELGAFDWGCDASGGAGNVFFYTYGLKKSKGLADLVRQRRGEITAL